MWETNNDLIGKMVPLLLGIITGLMFLHMSTGPEVTCSLEHQGGKSENEVS